MKASLKTLKRYQSSISLVAKHEIRYHWDVLWQQAPILLNNDLVRFLGYMLPPGGRKQLTQKEVPHLVELEAYRKGPRS